MDPGSLSIGQVADAAGVTTTTLRHYDAIGLVTPAARVGGKRRYTDAAELIDQALACECDDLEGCDRTGHDRPDTEQPVSASWVTDPTRPIA